MVRHSQKGGVGSRREAARFRKGHKKEQRGRGKYTLGGTGGVENGGGRANGGSSSSSCKIEMLETRRFSRSS